MCGRLALGQRLGCQARSEVLSLKSANVAGFSDPSMWRWALWGGRSFRCGGAAPVPSEDLPEAARFPWAQLQKAL